MISTVCKLSGRQGVTLAGKVALKIDPDILEGLASQVRNKIFVVCGTNGKTTTKELIAAVLTQKYKVHYTKGNLNNHIGVPLTILSMPIFELSIIS